MPVASFFNQVTLETVKKAYEYMGYAYFEKGDYNLNIFGIRNNDMSSGQFNDIVGVTYKVDGNWRIEKWDATTDPGTYYWKNLMNSLGTAIQIPGQYRGAYRIGIHRNKYEALRQYKPIKYWRDANSDGKLDLGGKVYEEVAYTNIHRATNSPGEKSINTSNWSAGCIVVAAYDDFARLMYLSHRSVNLYGPNLTWTLFTENNFFCKDKELIGKK